MQTFLAALLICAGCSLFLGAERAGATEIGTEPFQTWADEALVPTPKRAYIVPGTSEISSAQVTDRIYIHWYFDEATTARFPLSRPLFLHELGHVYDFTMLKDRTRGELADLFKFPVDYWGVLFTEKFAMLYSECALGQTPQEAAAQGWFGYGYFPSSWKHYRACKLIRSRA